MDRFTKFGWVIQLNGKKAEQTLEHLKIRHFT